MNLTISAPYPEGAIGELIRRRTEAGFGDQVLARADVRLRLPGRRTNDHAAQFAVQGATVYLGVLPEIVRLALRALRLPTALRRDAMYWQFRRFDEASVRHLDEDGSVLIGMPGACRSIFLENRRRGGFNVLHAVNAHPMHHNDALRQAYPDGSASDELVPILTVKRVDEEIGLADLILCPSSFTAEGFVRHGTEPSKVSVLPYAVNGHTFGGPELVGNDLASSKSFVSSLYVGQISYRKGVPALINVFRSLPSDRRLRLAGPIVNKNILRNLPPNVTYLGVLSRSMVAAEFNRADNFVLPSVEDACALVTFEAAASGLPIYTSHSNGASECLAPDSWWSVSPLEFKQMHDALYNGAPLGARERAARRFAFARTLPGMGWEVWVSSVVALIQDKVDKN